MTLVVYLLSGPADTACIGAGTRAPFAAAAATRPPGPPRMETAQDQFELPAEESGKAEVPAAAAPAEQGGEGGATAAALPPQAADASPQSLSDFDEVSEHESCASSFDDEASLCWDGGDLERLISDFDEGDMTAAALPPQAADASPQTLEVSDFDEVSEHESCASSFDDEASLCWDGEDLERLTSDFDEGDIAAAAAPTAASEDGVSPLHTEEMYDYMCQTKVVLSFASARGGVQLALQLREQLLTDMTWPKGSVYIDAVSLRDHRCTVAVADGTLRNPHWAEFYYMGTLITQTVVIVFDSAWNKSDYCQGELALFFRNVRDAYEKSDAAPTSQSGSKFQLIVLYDTACFQHDTVEADLERTTGLGQIAGAPPVVFLPVELSGHRDAGGSISASSYQQLKDLIQQVDESAQRRDECVDRKGYALVYEIFWRNKALSQQAGNKQEWWWYCFNQDGAADDEAREASRGSNTEADLEVDTNERVSTDHVDDHGGTARRTA